MTKNLKFPRRKFLHLAAGAAALPVTSRAARAQAWPSRTVRVVSPFAAGIGPDPLARIVGNGLSENWRIPVIVENKVGGGGNIGNETVARSAPDGYTILCNGPATFLNKHLYNRLSYDPISDFAPVVQLCTFPNIMVVPTSSPANSVKEFISYAKDSGGRVKFAISGVGTSQHLSGELLKRMTGIEMITVPYRDVSYMNDLFTGRVDMMFGTPAGVLEQHKAGHLRALAVTNAKRSPAAPDIPTMVEAGVPGYEVSSWFAFFVPAKTSSEIIRKLNADVIAVLSGPEVKKKIEQLGYEVVSSTPEELGRFFTSENEKWGRVIKEAGIKLD